MSPQEAPVPQVHRVLAGHFRETLGYGAYRAAGTTDYLLLHTVSGAGIVGSRGGRSVTAGDRTAVLLEPGVLHDYRVDPTSGRWDFLFAHFHPRPEWSPLLLWPQVQPGVGVLVLGEDGTRRLIAALTDTARFSQGLLPNAELFAANSLERALLWYNVENPRARPLDERVLRVMDTVERSPAAAYSVAALAQIATLSPSRFSELFREQTGLTPARYVERQRLNLAAQLLELTDRTIADIAREVGFEDPLYFSTRFRQRTGLSPRPYRSRSRPGS